MSLSQFPFIKYRTHVLLVVVLVLLPLCTFAQPIDYSDYRVTFFDDFVNYSSKHDNPEAFKSNSAFNKIWNISKTDWGHGNELYVPQNVIMPRHGIMRLIATPAQAPYDSIERNGETRPVLYHAGFLRLGADYNTRDRNYGYGIVEAAIKFPREVGPNYKTNEISFWMWGHNGTEIDIFDVSFPNYFTTRAWDWKTPQTIWKSELMHPSDNPAIPNINDDSFHIFSAQWTPSVIRYYIDEVFISSVYYTDIRTRPYFYNLEMAIMPVGKNYFPHQYMEVDWVKIWKRTCEGKSYSNTGKNEDPYSYKIPASGRHFYYKNIDIAGANTINTFQDVPTFIESERTTISGNFLVDQSSLIEHYSTIDNPDRKSDKEPPYIQYKQTGNAYFEIAVKHCTNY